MQQLANLPHLRAASIHFGPLINNQNRWQSQEIETHSNGYDSVNEIILLDGAIDADVVHIHIFLQLSQWQGLEVSPTPRRNWL
jgi:hypothetical protein